MTLFMVATVEVAAVLAWVVLECMRRAHGETSFYLLRRHRDAMRQFNGAAYPRDGPEHLDQEGVLPLFLFRQRLNH